MAQYTPKTWTTGETITAAELNAIEQAAAAAAVASDIPTAGTPTGDALRAAFASTGPTDPGPSLPHGTEYVWMKTDGSGTLLDILAGVA